MAKATPARLEDNMPKPYLSIVFSAVKVTPMSSKNAANYDPNTNCPVADDPNTIYEEIDATYDAPNINCATFGSANISISDDITAPYEEIDAAYNEPNINQGGRLNIANEPTSTYEDVDTVYDRYKVPPLPGLHIDAIAIYKDTSLPRPSDEPSTVYAEYDEVDVLPPTGLQVNAVGIYDPTCIQSAANTQCLADFDQEHATHTGGANGLHKNR